MRATLADRLLAYSDRRGGDDGCWLWLSTVNDSGYGVISIDKRPLRAHRVMYEHLVGPIPDGLELDHLCHDTSCTSPGVTDPHRRCVNPRHLEPVTGAVNVQRSQSALNNTARAEARTHCRKGHALAGHNVMRFTGREKRRCRTCHNINAAASRERARSIQVVGNGLR